MKERIRAVIQGHEVDRVPFLQYSDCAGPDEEVRSVLGNRIGILYWFGVCRIEYPNCRTEVAEFEQSGCKCLRTTIHTPAGNMFEERRFEPALGSSSVYKHFVEEPLDYDVLTAYLNDGVIFDNTENYEQIEADIGDSGHLLPAVRRTPYQQLWVQWTGLDHLSWHLADCPERVESVVDTLNKIAMQTFEIAYRSPVPFVDFPDNITSPAIGVSRFEKYCLPLYNRLAEMLESRGALVFVHMDGDIKPLWDAIGHSRIGGLESLSPPPDNDTSVGDIARMWPEKRVFVNFPSSVHLQPPKVVRAATEKILQEGGHTGRLAIQISENMPPGRWRTTLPIIADAVEAFGKP